MSSHPNSSAASDLMLDARTYLDAHFPWFYTNVVNLGVPVESNAVDSITLVTASAGGVEHEGHWQIAYNPDFVVQHDCYQIAAMISHEILHLRFSHMTAFHEDGGYGNTEAAGLAADIIVNDYLDRQVSREARRGVTEHIHFELPEDAVRGADVGIQNSWKLGFDEVYDRLVEMMDEEPQGGAQDEQGEDGDGDGGGDESNDGGEGGESGEGQGDEGDDQNDDGQQGGGGSGGEGDSEGDSGQGSGSGNPVSDLARPMTQGGGMVNDHSDQSEAVNSSDFDKAVDDETEANRKANKDTRGYQQGWIEHDDDVADFDEKEKDVQVGAPGTSVSEGGFTIQRTPSVSLKWKSLMEKIAPGTYVRGNAPKTNWGRPSRKVSGQYPRLILPSRDPDPRNDGGEDKPAIVLAVDVSGSIPDQVKRKFAELGASIPTDKVDVFGCTFSTEFWEVDFAKGDVPGGGGTNFSAISDFILMLKREGRLKKYPNVVVFTDGEADFSGYMDERGQRSTWGDNDRTPSKKELQLWSWLTTKAEDRIGWGDNEFRTFAEEHCFVDVLDNYSVKKKRRRRRR